MPVHFYEPDGKWTTLDEYEYDLRHGRYYDDKWEGFLLERLARDATGCRNCKKYVQELREFVESKYQVSTTPRRKSEVKPEPELPF